jgi:hypothetical protein
MKSLRRNRTLKGDVEEVMKKDPKNPQNKEQLDSMVIHSIPLVDDTIDDMLDILLRMKSMKTKAKMRVTLLTQEEHDKFVHPCGLTGKQLDEAPGKCKTCDKQISCLKSHSIIGEDDGVDKSRL